jgi:hypothetical protein
MQWVPAKMDSSNPGQETLMRVVIAIALAATLCACADLRKWAGEQQGSQDESELALEQQRLTNEQMAMGLPTMNGQQATPSIVFGHPTIDCTSSALRDGFVSTTCH